MTQPLPAADVVAIHDLYARYCHLIDFGEPAEWARLFTPTGVFERIAASDVAGVGPVRVSGPAELADFAQVTQQRWQRSGRHWVTNIVLHLRDDQVVHGSCYLMVLRVTGENAPAVVGTATFDDLLAEVDGQWRFVHRTVRPDR